MRPRKSPTNLHADLIERLGGPQVLSDLLNATAPSGHSVSAHAIGHWSHKGRVAWRWRPQVAEIAHKAGLTIPPGFLDPTPARPRLVTDTEFLARHATEITEIAVASVRLDRRKTALYGRARSFGVTHRAVKERLLQSEQALRETGGRAPAGAETLVNGGPPSVDVTLAQEI